MTSNIECSNLEYNTELSVVIERSTQDTKPHTNYQYLNLKQMNQLVVKYSESLNFERLESLNSKRSLYRSNNKVSDYKRFINLIGNISILKICLKFIQTLIKHFMLGNNDISRVRQVIKAALNKGSSINALIDQLTRALTGKLNSFYNFYSFWN